MIGLAAVWLCAATVLAAPADRCAVCGAYLSGTVYVMEDKLTHEKKDVCPDCSQKLPNCFICSLPSLTNAPGAVRLEDGRALCARDAKTAVLDEAGGAQLGQTVKEDLGRLFARFLSMPDRNVSFAIMDRVHLLALFKVPGNDVDCPNIWGRAQVSTNAGRLEHRITVLSGLPQTWFRSTCAHECGHTWLTENMPAERKAGINRNAVEGFCELLAYLYAEHLGDAEAKSMILANTYSRGQIQVFVETEKQYGLNDIVEWIKYGTDPELSAENLSKVKSVQAQARRSAPAAAPAGAGYRLTVPKVPDRLVLNGIFWHPTRPSAIVNGCTFRPGQEGEVRIGSSNVLVRCVQIGQQSVRMKWMNTGAEQELKITNLKPASDR